MKDVIEALAELKDDLEDMRGVLQGVEWPSRAITRLANDLNTWLGMAVRTALPLLHTLEGLEGAKREVTEIIEEERDGKVPSEQVSEPENREGSDKVSTQEPGGEKPPGD